MFWPVGEMVPEVGRVETGVRCEERGFARKPEEPRRAKEFVVLATRGRASFDGADGSFRHGV